MDKQCEKNRDILAEMLTHSLPDEQKIYIESHLADCPDCRDYLDKLKADHHKLAAFAASFEGKIAALEQKVIQQAKDETGPARNIAPFKAVMSAKWARAAIAAMVLIIIGIGAYLLIDQGNSSATDNQKMVNVEGMDNNPAMSNDGSNLKQPQVVASSGKIEFAAAQLNKIKGLFKAKDIDALTALARSEDIQTRTAAVNYLVKLGTEEALLAIKLLLDEAAQQGGPDQQLLIDTVEQATIAMLAATGHDQADASNPLAAADSPELENDGPGMFVRVVDAKGKPIVGATVSAQWEKEPRISKTDATGRSWASFGEKQLKYLSLSARKAGFVGMRFYWNTDKIGQVPETYTFTLEKGIVIGGTVVNEEGNPVKDAKVKFSVRQESSTDGPRQYFPEDDVVVTDSRGKWTADTVPDPEKVDYFYINLAHTDYVDDDVWGRRKDYTTAQLKDKSAVLVMKSGVALAGYVVDQGGKPIEAATVLLGEYRSSNAPQFKTDSKGLFTFPSLPLGGTFVTVRKRGHAPEVKEVNVTLGIEPVEIVLGPPNMIIGRVTDSDGTPIKGVRIGVQKWRGVSTLNIRTKTKTDGRFALDNAPADEVKLDFYKKNYMSVRDFSAIAGEEEYEIVMYDTLKVSGTVTDAVTGESVLGKLKAISGIDWGNENQRVYWERDSINDKEFTGGKYEMQFDHPYPGHLIKIEAEGYLPAVSRVFDSNEEAVTYNFKLSTGEGMTGIVYRPDFSLASGTEVYLVTAGSYLNLENNRNRNRRDSVYVTTGPDGKFSFPPQTEDFAIVAISEDGFAEVLQDDFLVSSDIHLKAFGRIEGDLYIGTKPGINESISLYYSRPHSSNGINFGINYKATTDDEGNFVVENVVPGKIQVSRVVWVTDRRSTHTHTKHVELESGQTAVVNLGGGGRPVIGKFAAPLGYTGTIDFTMGHASIRSKRPEMDQSGIYEIYDQMQDDIPRPTNFDSMTVAEVMQWFQDWHQSEEGQAFQQKIQEMMQEKAGTAQDVNKNYSAITQPDGIFRVEDVAPGTYTLDIRVYQRGQHGNADYKKPIGKILHDFTVPELAEGDEDNPLDLGTITLENEVEKSQGLIGQPVPELTAETLDGDTLRLSDYRGKIVLLNFWTFQKQETAEAEMENMKSIYETFADEDTFDVLGLTMGGFGILGKELAQKYVDEKGIPWPQAIIKMGDFYKLHETFGLNKYPFNVLIGPDGKIIAAGLEGDELKTKVAEAIAAVKEPKEAPTP